MTVAWACLSPSLLMISSSLTSRGRCISGRVSCSPPEASSESCTAAHSLGYCRSYSSKRESCVCNYDTWDTLAARNTQAKSLAVCYTCKAVLSSAVSKGLQPNVAKSCNSSFTWTSVQAVGKLRRVEAGCNTSVSNKIPRQSHDNGPASRLLKHVAHETES